MAKHRQVDRAMGLGEDALRQNALDQLSTAVILHVDAAWDHIRWQVKMILRLRCGCCGERHVRAYYRPANEQHYYGKQCDYGWFRNFSHLVTGAMFHLRHGVD